MELPIELINLEANCGIYAVWMILQHHSIVLEIEQLKQACAYDDEDGTFGIGLAVGLKKLGFDVYFHTEHDPDLHEKEYLLYEQAQQLKIHVQPALNYHEIQNAVANRYFAIVYYDTLEGVGNHSLIYEIDEQKVSFFDHFETMPRTVFEAQRHAEGICQQVILVGMNQTLVRPS